MRLRSTTTTTGATTWRVGPSGMAPLPGWRRVLFRRDRRSVRRGPADGLRPASWSGTGPWPARVGGTGALRRNGDLFANSVRTCGPAGCWGSSPGRLYLFSPLPLPSPWSVLFPAPIPGGALEPKVRGRGFFCAGRHGEGQRLQGLRLLAASSGAGPDGPKRFTATTTSTEGVTWICSRCSVPWTRTSIDLARARAAFVAGHGPQVVAERRRPGPGVDPDATGGGHQVPPRPVSASGDGLRIHARRAPGPTPGGTPPVRAGIGNRARTRPWQVDSRCSGTGPWPDGVAGQAPFGAVAGTADAKACVRGAVGCDPRGSPLRRSGRASSSASGAWCCPSRARAQRRRETEPHRHPATGPHRVRSSIERAVQNDPNRPTAQRLPSPQRRGHPPLRRPLVPRVVQEVHSARKGYVEPLFRTNRMRVRPLRVLRGVPVPAGRRGIAKPETDPVVWQHVDRPGHGSSTTWTTRTESGTGRATSAISPWKPHAFRKRGEGMTCAVQSKICSTWGWSTNNTGFWDGPSGPYLWERSDGRFIAADHDAWGDPALIGNPRFLCDSFGE